MSELAPQTTEEDHKYDDMFSQEPLLPAHTVEAAAVRPAATKSEVTIEADRQASIAAADRANRQDAGLAPRVLDLK